MFDCSAALTRHAIAHLTLALSFSLTAHASLVTPAPVVQTTAYRCSSIGGAFQYQQMPCKTEGQAALIRVADNRTTEQQRVASRQADRDQDLAQDMTKLRQRHERQALKMTAEPRPLTVQPKLKSPQPEPAMSALKVVPRKRDFRAVSAKPEGSQRRRSRGHQPV